MVPTALMTDIRVIHVIMLCSYSGEQPRTPQSDYGKYAPTTEKIKQTRCRHTDPSGRMR